MVSFDDGGCEHWNFQLCNHWMENLADYARARGYIDSENATCEPGGRVRIVVAPTDPGVANWVDPGHRDHGVMGLRFVQPVTAPRVSAVWWPSVTCRGEPTPEKMRVRLPVCLLK